MRGSLVAQLVKTLSAVWEAWIRSPGEGKATHSSILAGELHGPHSPRGRKELDVMYV